VSEATTGNDPRSDRRRSGFDALRTERWIALIRLAVVAVVIAIYLGSLAEGSGPSPAAIALLSFAVMFSVWSLVAFAGPEEPSSLSRILSVLVDLTLVTAWVQVTGGVASEYWALYLVVLISVALRYDFARAAGAAVVLALLYGGAAVAAGLPEDLVANRTALMLITGFAAGVLSQQRLVHRRRGQEFQAVAEERSRELTQERAEVERLRRVDIAKSEFVAIAAHEFRTPLAAIIGVLTTLREHGSVLTTGERVELIDGATSQATRLARLVEDLLTVSRIEDGVIPLQWERTDPRELLAEATSASGMSGRLLVEVGPVRDVRCDRDAIVRVLTNLLDNARKYAPDGSRVHVTLSLEGDLVRFAVADEGPGIPEDERDEVFERFRRLDGGSSKPGEGLGLYICRGLVEAHGGSIRVDDGPKGGAEFSFTLPRATARDDEGAVDVGPDDGVDVGPDDIGTLAGEGVGTSAEPGLPSTGVR
jgi:signal transduction histidine kinase